MTSGADNITIFFYCCGHVYEHHLDNETFTSNPVKKINKEETTALVLAGAKTLPNCYIKCPECYKAGMSHAK
jgi:antirestriction protein